MRLINSIILPAICCASQAVASAAGTVYIYEAQRRDISDERRTLSPTAARMVLAQRAGVEEFHSADLQHGDAIQAINDFGAKSQLFGQGEKERQQYIFLVEVADENDDAFGKFLSLPGSICNS